MCPISQQIHHKYAYHFKTTSRSKIHKSGLDYTKIVIVNKSEYIDEKNAIIDKDEFNETMMHLDKIKAEALQFVEDYIKHHKKVAVLHEREYYRRYAFSTLQYFHKELGI